MKLIANVPEAPIVEDWAWTTNTIVATDGTEQRISLSEFPKRSMNLQYGFDSEDEVRKITTAMMLSGEGFAIPFFQAATRLTASAAIGAGAVAFDAGRTDLRSGADALIFDAAGRVERVTLAVVSIAGATLAAPLVGAWGKRASIAPIWDCYASGSLAVTRNNPDQIAALKAGFTEFGFMEPFANEFADFDFTTLGGLPILAVNATGSEFEQSYDSGMQTIDYGNNVEIRNPWLHSQIVMPRVFLCQRVLQPATWAMWRALADYAKGSTNPFYVPTFRQDFGLHTAPVAGGTTLSFEGIEFHDNFAPFAPFKQLAFFLEDGGVHYAAVSNCVIVGSNSNVTFTPALPGGVTVEKVSLLLKVRIADDKISCQHESLHTMLTINLRTAD